MASNLAASGGGIYLTGPRSYLRVSGSTFARNTANGTAASSAATGLAGAGGAAYVEQAAGVSLDTGSTFLSNAATSDGGALYLSAVESVYLFGVTASQNKCVLGAATRTRHCTHHRLVLSPSALRRRMVTDAIPA